MNSQSILPASCTSSCFMLMIWSSRARNRSADPVVSCFFGRIAPSDAATESCFSIRGNRENEFASFQGLRHGNLAISSQQSRQKTTLAQWVRNSSRATSYRRPSWRPSPFVPLFLRKWLSHREDEISRKADYCVPTRAGSARSYSTAGEGTGSTSRCYRERGHEHSPRPCAIRKSWDSKPGTRMQDIPTDTKKRGPS